ncbi:MAG: hypothetical protein RO469_17605 [Thermincola sp.]|nr:hypothetical protein [Thermincola sp.]
MAETTEDKLQLADKPINSLVQNNIQLHNYKNLNVNTYQGVIRTF